VLDQQWVFVSAALGLLGSLRYAHATLRGHARPNRVSFFLWAAAPMIAFSAQLSSGVGAPAIPTLAAGVGPLIVLTASMVSRHGRVRVTRFDLACGAISVVALVVWLGLDDAPLAVVVAVIADGAAAVPTLLKSWRDPHSENALFYGLVGIGAAITLLTITSWEVQEWAFAAYILALAVLLVGIIIGRRRTMDRTEAVDHG
jgi:hypothetical protein